MLFSNPDCTFEISFSWGAHPYDSYEGNDAPNMFKAYAKGVVKNTIGTVIADFGLMLVSRRDTKSDKKLYPHKDTYLSKVRSVLNLEKAEITKELDAEMKATASSFVVNSVNKFLEENPKIRERFLIEAKIKALEAKIEDHQEEIREINFDISQLRIELENVKENE